VQRGFSGDFRFDSAQRFVEFKIGAVQKTIGFLELCNVFAGKAGASLRWKSHRLNPRRDAQARIQPTVIDLGFSPDQSLFGTRTPYL